MVMMVLNNMSVLNVTELNTCKIYHHNHFCFVYFSTKKFKYCSLNIAADTKVLQLNMKVNMENIQGHSLYKYDCSWGFREDWVELKTRVKHDWCGEIEMEREIVCVCM